jgi:hypothetical protein
MKEPNSSNDKLWDRGWDEHKKRQQQRLAKLSFAEKLEWLEEAQEFGERLIAQGNRSKIDQKEQ